MYVCMYARTYVHMDGWITIMVNIFIQLLRKGRVNVDRFGRGQHADVDDHHKYIEGFTVKLLPVSV